MMAPRHLGSGGWSRFELAELTLYAMIALVSSVVATFAILGAATLLGR